MHRRAELAVTHHPADRREVVSVVGNRCSIETDLVTAPIWNPNLATIFLQMLIEGQRHDRFALWHKDQVAVRIDLLCLLQNLHRIIRYVL